MSSLTPRQLELSQLVAAGFSNQQIAQKLLISRQTVKNHMQAIYKKLGVRNRVQLTLWLARSEIENFQPNSMRQAS